MSSLPSRREFLRALLGTSLGASVAAAACDQKHAQNISGSLLGQNLELGHQLRSDLSQRIAHIAGTQAQRTDVLIVGGGPAGLSAAYGLHKHGQRDVLVLELERELGGTSLAGSSALTAYPWGAHYLPVPARDNLELAALLREMSVIDGVDDQGRWRVREPYLVRAPDERIFYRGYWYPGLYLQAGATERDRAQLAAFDAEIARYAALRDSHGKRAFTIPISRASQAPELCALDSVPATRWLSARGLDSPRLLWLLDYACRDDYGTRLSHTSAWALLLYFAARIDAAPSTPAVPGDRQNLTPAELITWPEGNAALVAHLRKHSGARIQTGEIVLDVHPTPEGVHVYAWNDAQDVPKHYLAQHAVLAVPRFIACRIVRPLREQQRGAQGFEYAPWIVANLHLHERPQERGVPPAWDNVLYDSPSLGYVSATHQRGSDFGPTVLTYYLPLAHVDARTERMGLLRGTWSDYRDGILGDLGRAHPNLRDVVNKIDVFRWGHAMVKPLPGFITSSARRDAQKPLGAIHFAHTDLSGVALFEEAFDHGLRAAREITSGPAT